MDPFFSWLYDILVDAFKGTLKSAIQNAITSELAKLVKNTLDQILASYPFRVPIDNATQCDFTFPIAPVFGFSMMRVGIIGAFEQLPSNFPPAIPHGADISNQSVSSRAIDFFIDQYLPNTAFLAYFNEGRLQGTVTDSMIPKNFPIRLNTSSWANFIPGLFAKYPNQAMQLFFSFAEAPVVLLRPENSSSFQGNGLASCSVPSKTDPSGWQEVFTLGVDGLIGAVSVNFTGDTITGEIGTASFNLSVKDSSVGPIDTSELNDFIGLVINAIVLPEINKFLAKGFPIPTIDGLTFSNPQIVINTGFIRVGADVNYKPSTYVFY